MFAIILKVRLEECELYIKIIPHIWRVFNLMIFFDKSVFGEVMTLVDVNPTIFEDYENFMHVDHEDKILYDSYIVEFDYDPTCNYYERGKYGGKNSHVTKLPLVMLRFLLFLSYSLHMLVFACPDNLFSYRMPMHSKYAILKIVFHMLYDALFVL